MLVGPYLVGPPLTQEEFTLAQSKSLASTLRHGNLYPYIHVGGNTKGGKIRYGVFLLATTGSKQLRLSV